MLTVIYLEIVKIEKHIETNFIFVFFVLRVQVLLINLTYLLYKIPDHFSKNSSQNISIINIFEGIYMRLKFNQGIF